MHFEVITGVVAVQEKMRLREEQIADIVHSHGNGCKVALQLYHCGRQNPFAKDLVASSPVFDGYLKKHPER